MKIDYPFTNHMVIQRNKIIKITGQSDDQTINIYICGKNYTTKVKNHHWKVELQFDFYGGPYEMVIKSENEEIVFDDVLIGDVFLAAGQSNMEMTLSQCEEELSNYKENVRFLNVPQFNYPFTNKETSWQKLTKENSYDFSALATFFACSLQENIPIGIISNNKGGTSASCWMSEKYLKKDKMIKEVYWNQYYNDLPSIEKQKQNSINYYREFDDYQKKFNQYKCEHEQMSLSQIKNIIGHTPWPPPKGIYDFGQPSGLYQHMFKKTVHYPVKAILYYQGEEDSSKHEYYKKLLSLLIDNWREDYQECLPFIIIQLPEYENSHFSEIRLAQWQVSEEKENTFLVVSLLTGNPTYIHPTRKKELAQRVAMCVEKNIYNKDVNLFPIIQKIEVNDCIAITFDQKLKDHDIHLTVDQKEVKGTVKSNQVVIPLHSYKEIRYACSDCPQVDIISLHGYPCTPFVIKNKKL